MKKLILFVDDDQFRHEVFIESVLGQDINTDHAFDVLEAIDFLEKEKHDEVWLDHDFDKTDSTRNGFDLALWMTSHMDPIPVVIFFERLKAMDNQLSSLTDYAKEMLIQRARKILSFTGSEVETADILTEAGVSVEDCFLAVKAAKILLR